MPAPWLIARKSGIYCRIFIPADLRPIIGQRYLVRPLGARNKDDARLLAAQYAWVVGELFCVLRQELSMPEPKGEPSVEDVLRTLKSGTVREVITIKGWHNPTTGARIDELTLETPEDARIASRELGLSLTGHGAPAPTQPYRFLPEHGALISTRLAEFISAREKDNVTTKYINEVKLSLSVLIDVAGDLPPDDYTPSIIDTFIERISFLPPNPDKDKQNRDRWAQMSYAQICNDVELFELPRIHVTTVGKHIARLSAFFEFCRMRRYMQHSNPMEARGLKKNNGTKGNAPTNQDEREAFSIDDLELIFSPENYSTRKLPHTFWPPLISLMTGTRVNEVAQLYVDDIVDDDPSHPGRWRFMILAKEVDQRVKNPSSLRSIPMHPKLIELGFLEYLKDLRRLGHKRVFPTLRYTESSGYGDTVSDYFSGYLREIVGIKSRQKVFHSFRYYVCSELFNKSKNERMHIVSITGHAREGVFERKYAGELQYEKKLEILSRLALPNLQITPYKTGRFDKFFKNAELKRAAALRNKKPEIEIK